MAYKGLTDAVYAPITAESPEGIPTYGTGGIIGRAIKYELSAEYEDTSEYSDMNDLDPAQEFAYADLTFESAEVDSAADLVMYGHDADSDGIVCADIDTGRPCGVGCIRPKTIRGTVTWTVTWLYKVFFLSVKDDTETRGKDIAYSTPEVTARVVPLGDGRWKHTYEFETKDEARTFLYAKAGINQ